MKIFKGNFISTQQLLLLISWPIIHNFFAFKSLPLYFDTLSIHSTSGLFKALAYPVTYVFASWAMLPLILSQSNIIRFFSFFFIFLTLALQFSYVEINGHGLSFNEIIIAMQELSFINDALAAFSPHILKASLIALLFCSILFFMSQIVNIRYSKKSLFLTPFLVAGMFGILLKTHFSVENYPHIFRLPFSTLTYFIEKDGWMYYGAREEVKISHDKNAITPEKIFYIVDESVRGDYFSINGFSEDTTPYLNSQKDLFINFGAVSSSSNCSLTANIALQSGLQLQEIPDKNHLSLKQPNIFQFAKNAGYNTVYIDGQRAQGKTQNYMSRKDLKFIDQFIQPKDFEKSVYKIDHIIARKLSEIEKIPGKHFIYINKSGSHFPYDQKFSPEHVYFKPILEDGIGFSTDTVKLINGYKNSIRWNVDEFFKILLPQVDFKNTSIVYTSDHGQVFTSGAKGTHCTSKTAFVDQAVVPILLFGGHFKNFFKNKAVAVNKQTHFSIFSSILTLMGYEKKEIEKKYGDPLWVTNNEQRFFLSGDIFGHVFYKLNKFD